MELHEAAEMEISYWYNKTWALENASIEFLFYGKHNARSLFQLNGQRQFWLLPSFCFSESGKYVMGKVFWGMGFRKRKSFFLDIVRFFIEEKLTKFTI